MNQPPSAFWSISAAEMLQQLGATGEGLAGEEARQRLARYGSNLLKPQARSNALTLLLGQFKSPIVLLLLFATGLSFFLHDPVNAFIILAIVLASGLLGFWQEHSATRAVEKLLAMVQVKATALRDGKPQDIPVEEIVPGDIVILNAGDLVPGDCLVDESKDLFVDEATLTGETYPAEKSVGVLAAETPLAKRTNALWMGTHVVSGSARALVVVTGKQTEFGKVSERLKLRPEETEFERGIRRFGYFLMEVTLVLVMVIFAINLYLAASGPGIRALFTGARGRAHAAIVAGDHQHQPGPRRQADGASQGDRQAARLDRELRQHERDLLRQDRHADRRHRALAIRAGCGRQSQRQGASARVSQRVLRDRLYQPDRRSHSHPSQVRSVRLQQGRRDPL